MVSLDDIKEKVYKIDRNVAVVLSKQESIIKILEKHDKSIVELERLKNTIYGVSLVISGIFSIAIACIIQAIV